MNQEQLKQLEKDLWAAADNLRANSDLKSSEYATPVLGLIFLKFADNKYASVEDAIAKEYADLKGTRREKAMSEIAIAKCGFYLPERARFTHLLNLPEEADIAQEIKHAMEEIENYKPELEGVLPKDEYFRLTRTNNSLPGQLLKTFSNIPKDASGDVFGKIYEYFLAEFALAEGQGGGEFFTPTSVVRLMVEIIEPYQGTVFDPACGSGGMFVQSQQFIEDHRRELAAMGDTSALGDIFVYGQEKTLDTVKLAKMNLAVNGLRGDVRQANSYAEDPFASLGKFDFVMANPPFNVDEVPVATVEHDPRFNTYGIPRKKTKAKKGQEGKETVPNANYLWINLFATSLKNTGRAALVMANSASDARHSEAEIRKTLIEKNLIYSILTMPSNMFYTVTLPATLWFFDKAKQDDRILFIDARNIFTQIDRAHREFSDAQIQNIAVISKLHRGNRLAFVQLVDRYFEQGMVLLAETEKQIPVLTEHFEAVFGIGVGDDAISKWISGWEALGDFQKRYATYKVAAEDPLLSDSRVTDLNRDQQALRDAFAPFFETLETHQKNLEKWVRNQEPESNGDRGQKRKIRQLKDDLARLDDDWKKARSFFGHIQWLQERFPQATYEDVTGLCKLATLEEIIEQDYSLNPGRYVGVVIEEDGKTEEEFRSEIAQLGDQLKILNKTSNTLTDVILKNIEELCCEKS